MKELCPLTAIAAMPLGVTMYVAMRIAMIQAICELITVALRRFA